MLEQVAVIIRGPSTYITGLQSMQGRARGRLQTAIFAEAKNKAFLCITMPISRLAFPCYHRCDAILYHPNTLSSIDCHAVGEQSCNFTSRILIAAYGARDCLSFFDCSILHPMSITIALFKLSSATCSTKFRSSVQSLVKKVSPRKRLLSFH